MINKVQSSKNNKIWGYNSHQTHDATTRWKSEEEEPELKHAVNMCRLPILNLVQD